MLSHETASGLATSHSFLRILQEAQSRDKELQAKALAKEAEKLKAIRIPQDERYKRMVAFKDRARADRSGEEVVAKGGSEDQPLEVPIRREGFDPLLVTAVQEPRRKVEGVEHRAEWQEGFERKIRSLMVDFQLTDDPSQRLKHLDHMHKWFEDHGGKQVRKANKGPQYLTMDRDGDPPPGSTLNLPGLSQASLDIAPLYTPRRPDTQQRRSGATPRFPSIR